jgi:DNA repair protein RecO (recombination protein O)
MLFENAHALVVRKTDWSESSRIATFFTREHGKVRALAKGGRRLRSNFEVALDLLTLCSIVFIRKSSGLDLLTEARAEERFVGIRANLGALYAGYYVAELLGDGTQDHDPHPLLFDNALQTLRDLNAPNAQVATLTMRFELAWLNELGYRPRLDACAVCGSIDWLTDAARFVVSALAGGLLCPNCEKGQRDKRPISHSALLKLRELGHDNAGNPGEIAPMLRAELRQIIGQFVSFVLNRRPRLLAYLE